MVRILVRPFFHHTVKELSMKTIMSLVLFAMAAMTFVGCGAPANVESKPANTNTNANAAKPVAAAPSKEAILAVEKSAYDAWKNKDAAFWDPFLSAKFVG